MTGPWLAPRLTGSIRSYEQRLDHLAAAPTQHRARCRSFGPSESSDRSELSQRFLNVNAALGKRVDDLKGKRGWYWAA